MQRLEVDDASNLIGYSAGWTPITGSSRQWLSAIHSTNLKGAWAAMNFQGARVVVYCTVPIGVGTSVHATVVLDGRTTSISRPTLANGTAIFNNILFDSGPIADVPHAIVLSNAGSATDSPLQLDRFHLEGTVFNPSPGKPAAVVPSPVPTTHSSTTISPTQSSISSSSSAGISVSVSATTTPPNSVTSLPISLPVTDSSGGAEIVSLPQDFKATGTASESSRITDSSSAFFFSHLVTSTKADGTVVTQIVDSPRTQSSSTSGHIPNGAIVGCVVGALVVILATILILLRLRKRRSKNGHMRLPDEKTNDSELTGVNPFDIHERSRASECSVTRAGLSDSRNEKSGNNQTRDVPASETAGVPVTASVSAGPQNLPNITVEFGHGSYVFVPHHQNAASSPSITSPETPSSVYSAAITSSAMLLSTEVNDMPPSYQVGV